MGCSQCAVGNDREIDLWFLYAYRFNLLFSFRTMKNMSASDARTAQLTSVEMLAIKCM